jgi:nucleotide-binding universal stress UspA family protein
MFHSILVPIDISDEVLSTWALKEAADIARGSQARVRLVYVRTLVPSSVMDFVPIEFDELEQANAEAKLSVYVKTVQLAPEMVSHVVRLGSIYHEVLAEAENVKADLIVIPSHRPTMATYLIGSNATTITRHATCSVLVLRKEA